MSTYRQHIVFFLFVTNKNIPIPPKKKKRERKKRSKKEKIIKFNKEGI